MNFGERVRDLRENAGINQSELGKQLGITQRKVSYIENNKYEPGIDDIRAICMYFNVSADYLLGLPDSLKYPKR